MSEAAASVKHGRVVRPRSLSLIGAGCVGASLAAVIAFFLLVGVHTANLQDETASGKEIASCLDRYTKNDVGAAVDIVNQWASYCFESNRKQLLIDEENIRKQNFVFQRHENSVLLIIVVVITLSGVLLAALQLLASYQLAASGRGELAGGAELTASADAVSFKSSVVGLVILVVSFAFFIVFIREVYTLKEVTTAGPSAPGMAPPPGVAPRQLFSGPLPKPTTNSAEQGSKPDTGDVKP